MSQVALSWLAARPAVSSVILGARTLDQLTANLPIGLHLSTEETALLDEVSAPRVDFPYGGAVAQQMTRRIEGGWRVIIGRAGVRRSGSARSVVDDVE